MTRNGRFAEEVFGHERPKHFCERMLVSDRIPTGVLFFGEVGVGKRLFAKAWLEAVFCEKRVAGVAAACGRCSSCVAVREDRHEDIHSIAPDDEGGVLSIEKLRELQAKFTLAPFRSIRRAAVIEDADRMTTEAQNSLLKLLEEPPRHGHLILLTSERQALLETIMSRVFRIYFGSLPQSGRSLLDRLAPDSKSRDLDLAWQASDGRPGIALELLDVTDGNEVEDFMNAMFGNQGRPFESVETVLGKKSSSASSADERRRLLYLVEGASAAIMSAIEDQSVGRTTLSSDVVASIRRDFSTAELTDLIGHFFAAAEHLKAYVAPRQVMSALAIRIQRARARSRPGTART